MAARKKQVARKAPAKRKTANKKTPALKPISKLSDAQREARWQAEDDMHTLMRAEEVKADKKRVAAAKKMAQQKAKEAAAVASKIKG